MPRFSSPTLSSLLRTFLLDATIQAFFEKILYTFVPRNELKVYRGEIAVGMHFPQVEAFIKEEDGPAVFRNVDIVRVRNHPFIIFHCDNLEMEGMRTQHDYDIKYLTFYV